MNDLPSREELIAKGYPYGRVNDDIPFGDPKTEWARTKPDVVVYTPDTNEGNMCGNESVSVLPTFDQKELIAIWTQCSGEGFGDNRTVIARSNDGIHWSEPKIIVGTDTVTGKQASWAFPVYTKSGRLYIFYMQETNHQDKPGADSGDFALMYSDDNGHTWSESGVAELPRNSRDNPDEAINKNWCVWQMPIRDSQDRIIAGFSMVPSLTWTGAPQMAYPHSSVFAACLCFENLDENPEPQDVKVTIFPNEGLSVPNKLYPEIPIAQEPAPALLPDGRLFATMRTMAGAIYYSVYENEAWREPKPLIGWDGNPVSAPLSPTPLYRLKDGYYVCFFNNNPGQYMGYDLYEVPTNWRAVSVVRNPLSIMAGKYVPNHEQPIQFSKPRQFMSTDWIALNEKKKACALSAYSAITEWRGKTMFWYPDRKFYVLGKEITPELKRELYKEICEDYSEKLRVDAMV